MMKAPQKAPNQNNFFNGVKNYYSDSAMLIQTICKACKIFNNLNEILITADSFSLSINKNESTLTITDTSTNINIGVTLSITNNKIDVVNINEDNITINGKPLTSLKNSDEKAEGISSIVNKLTNAVDTKCKETKALNTEQEASLGVQQKKVCCLVM